MAKVSTNNVGLRYAIETSLGTPPTTKWRVLEFNDLSTYGPEISTVERRPISPDRGRKKGTVVDLDSTVEFQSDLTLDAFTDFAEGFVFAEFANKEFDLKSGSGVNPPTPTATGYTIDAASALLAGKVQFDATGEKTLVYASGYATAANNGLKVLTADLAPSGTEITVSGLTAEASPPSNASLQVAGVRTDDLTLTISGSTATLTSVSDATDWVALGLQAGQFIHIGSATSAGAVQNAYSGNTVFGYARITSISGAGNVTLNLDKLGSALTGGPHVAGTIDVLFGRYLRNVKTTDAVDDKRYIERSYHFEASYPDLGGVGTTQYEYAKGNFADEFSIEVPLTDKAGATWGFIGTDTEKVTSTRKTGPSVAVSPLRTTAINTSSDIVSLTTDLITLAADVCFKSITVTFRNNVSPEKCLGTLGAKSMNVGLFEVNIEAQAQFTDKKITDSIRDNSTLTLAMILRNSDGAIVIDVPSLTFSGGGREFPVDETVLVNMTGTAFNNPTGTIKDVSLGVSLFANVPTA